MLNILFRLPSCCCFIGLISGVFLLWYPVWFLSTKWKVYIWLWYWLLWSDDKLVTAVRCMCCSTAVLQTLVSVWWGQVRSLQVLQVIYHATCSTAVGREGHWLQAPGLGPLISRHTSNLSHHFYAKLHFFRILLQRNVLLHGIIRL